MESGHSNYDKKPLNQDSCYYRIDSDYCFDCDGNPMSDFMEIINPRTMTCKLMENGVVVEEYKVEQCDKCSMLVRFDAFGFQKGYGNEKIIWFCQGCR